MKNSKHKAVRKKNKRQPFRWFISGFLYYTLKPLFDLAFRIFHNLKYDRNGFKLPKGPALFISNHHSNYDGAYMNTMFYPRIIRFVVNEELFYNVFASFFFGYLVGEIKRGMTTTDLRFIFEMKNYIKNGRSVGLYPEGDISMFGDTFAADKSLGKLAKMLDVPIVVMRISGAHLRAPRVANKARRGRITYQITNIISVDDVRTIAANDLTDLIYQGYQHHENLYQKEKMIKLRAKHRLAEWLELGLFKCPQCGSYQSLKSKDNDLTCTQCSFETTVNRYSFFTFDQMQMASDYPKFETTSEWNDWQIEQLHQHLDAIDGDDKQIFYFEKLRYHETPVGTFFRFKTKPCAIGLYSNRLEIYNEHGKLERTILLDGNVHRCLVQYKDVFEINFGDTRLRVKSRKRNFPAHLYVEAVKHILKKL